MRLKKSTSKNSVSLSVIKDVSVNGKRTTKVVEALGNCEDISKKYGVDDPFQWAKDYIKELNQSEKEDNRDVMVKFSTSKRLNKNDQRHFNGGYLFLQEIYYELQLDKICEVITERHKFEFDLNSILSRLIFGRILFPSSKLSTFKESKKFIEQPQFELHQVYRALEIIASESDYIQSQLYKNSMKICNRNSGILFYDCTNFYFEITEAEGLKQYGKSKENRPNPIVQMGLFTDGDGMPLSFSIFSGEASEQPSMKPLEEKILSDFELSKFIVCTDAGLSSTDNRKFNNKDGRAYITTQSIKKQKKHLRDWMFKSDSWNLPGKVTRNGELVNFDLKEIEDEFDVLSEKQDKTQKDYDHLKALTNNIYFKERWINEDGLEQRLIISYSLKYRNYQRSIRYNQIERATKAVSENKNLNSSKKTSYKRLIKTTNETKDGEVAKVKKHEVNIDKIMAEEIYDGYYGMCTNLEDDMSVILKTASRRWQIEECFRIMKSEFKARPVYLKRDDRIQAHFMTCFIALAVLKLLERKLQEEFTYAEIIDTLKEMNFLRATGNGYIPTYIRTDLTDILHDVYEFRTDYQIVDEKNMKKILKSTKSRNSTQKIKEKYKRKTQ